MLTLNGPGQQQKKGLIGMSSGDWAASFCWLQQENSPRKRDSNISQLVDLYRPQLALRSSLAIVNRNSLDNCLTCASSYIAGLTECVDLFSFSLSLSLKTHICPSWPSSVPPDSGNTPRLALVLMSCCV